ncbi:MAG: tetratricopeptide repeat-containing protein, partial [Candidatus Viridilinea halotolerans]
MSQTNPITQAFAATLADELAHHAPELAALLELAPEAIVTRLAERPVLAAALVSLVGRPLEVDGQSLQIVTGYVDSLQQITIAGGYVERIIGKVINFYLPPAPRVIDLAAAQELLAALPTETLAPVAPLPEQHHMPFARNPNFVGREADLVALAYALKGEGATAAIGSAAATTGLGGVGKTNLATEFAHRYGQFFAGGLFWLSFADPESIPLEIAACGMALDLPGFADLKLDDQVRRVRSAWAQSIPRLLIFDNCDETEPGRAEALIQQWRPTTGGCRVLITSRRGVWSASMGVTTLPLGVLNRAESIALLRKHRPDLAVDDPALDAIAVELGDLPLALHLAGSYLENYRDSAEFGDPTTFLSELRDTRLLDHEALQGVDSTPSPTNHELHVARTFALSYERLVANEQADAQALRLLARVAYLAPGNIVPRDLALATLMLEEEDRTGRRQAERGLRELLSLGLIEREGDDSLRMHRLVGAYVRQASADAGAQSMVEHMVTCVAGASSDASTPLAFINVFLPILRGVTDAALDRDKYAATLCARLGLYLDRLGSYASAQHYVEHALAISERVLGAEHSQTIIILNNLALLYKKQENFAAALPLYERALAVTEQTLGVDHPQTIISLNNLAEFYRAQGNYDAALPMLEHISVISERVLGIEHPDTIKSLNNLAGIYYEQGNCVLAQHLLERVMEFFDRVHGDSHPDTALSLNNLGMLHAEQGNYVVAFSLLERAVEIRERVLGAAHPDTALSLNNLAILHFEQGNHSKALSLFERALAIIEHVFGSEHSQVSICLNNLASMYNKQKNYAAAIPLYERALAINERVLGSEHISTATSLHNLAELHNEQGNLQAAEPLMSRALQILESQLGITHPKTQRIRQHFRVLQQQINGYPVHVIDLSRDMTNLISDIVSVSNGYNISRPPVIKILFQLEQNGVMLREPVERIWAGDRELEVLVDGLDDICTEIIKRVLDLIATNAANRQISPSCSKDISMSLIQSMPLPIIEALEHGDDGVLQKALADLPEAQRAEVITQLKNADILRREPDMAKMLRQFERLLRDIARVAMGDTSPRSAVEAALSRLEQEGWRLSAIVQQIWNGERDEARLICGVDAKSALLVQRILKLIRTTFSVQEEQQYLCERFDPLLADIAAIANGDDAPREQVTQALAQLAQNGWMLRGPVERIWAGERDRAALVAGLDEQDAALIERMLELIHTPASVAQVPLPPAPPDVVLSPSILAALASNDAAQLEAALAILAPDERTRVEAQLRAEAERVMQELTRRSSEEIVAGLPAAVRAALEQQDSDAIQAAMAALADNDRQRVMVDLGALRAHAVRAAQQQQQDPLERFAPLLEAIAAVANGDDAPR